MGGLVGSRVGGLVAVTVGLGVFVGRDVREGLTVGIAVRVGVRLGVEVHVGGNVDVGSGVAVGSGAAALQAVTRIEMMIANAIRRIESSAILANVQGIPQKG